MRLTYPGIPNQNYETLAEGYRRMTNLPAGVTVTTEPVIEEIIVSGDLGIVRVTWNTTTVQAEPAQRSRRGMRRRTRTHPWRLKSRMRPRDVRLRDACADGPSVGRQMRDLQVWRREADGWKFHRGMHFRVPPPQSATPPSGG